MPPARKASAGAGASTAPASSQQRSIASFFGAGGKPPASKTSNPPKAAKAAKVTASESNEPVLNIPPVNESTPAVKRPRTGSKPKSPTQTDVKLESKSEVKAPGSPEMNGAKKASPSSKKTHADGLQTPSPSEGACPAKSVTKCFGRREKNSGKLGKMGALPLLDSAKCGNGKGSADPGHSVVGMRLRVWWPLDKVWYPGKVKAYVEKTGRHVIAYDDGEDETVTLCKEKLDWLDEDEALEGLQKLAGARTNRRTLKPGDASPAHGKRKKEKGSDEDRSQESPNQKTNEADGSPGKFTRRNKRTRMTVVEDSPVKLTVTTDVYDEVDMVIPKEEEVKVRRRLKKVFKKSEDIKEVEMLDVEDEDLEVAKTLAEEGLELTKSSGRKSTTSARRLQLEEDIAELEPSTPEEDDAPLNETLADLASVKKVASNSDKSQSHKIAKDFFTKLGVKAPKITKESSPGALQYPSTSNGVKPVPIDKEALREALAGGLKSVSSSESTDIRKTSQEIEAEKLARGELHSPLVGEPAARFGGRVEERFKFLGRSRKDASGKRPSDPEYDPRTVYLPQDFLKGLSGGQRQWWEFKSKHMDKVLLFKMGKFYEMFEMDAHIGAQELDLQYMKGEQPHCGFPEKNYAVNAEKLARKGYRVLIVEQTETPDQLEQRRKETGSKDKVVKREVCGIISKGTLVDGDMLIARPDAAYLMSITERELPLSDNLENGFGIELADSSVNSFSIGVCTADTSTSHIMLGQFYDDVTRSRLRGLLAEIRPVEIVKPRGVLTESTERALKDHTRMPLVTTLTPVKEFWDAKHSLEEISGAYSSLKNITKRKAIGEVDRNGHAEGVQDLDEKPLPEAILRIVAAGNLGDLALSAMGGCLFYLKQAMLDQTILRLRRIDLLPGSDSFNMATSPIAEEPTASNGKALAVRHRDRFMVGGVEPYMLLDAAALENLELVENNRDGGSSGTLLAYLDYCVTPYGRRMLKQWLVRPLIWVDPIIKRQEAVRDLKGLASVAVTSFRKELRSQPDLERFLSRLHACSDESGRNAQRVVLYEDAAKKLLQELLATLRGCRAVIQAIKCFESVSNEFNSDRLKELVDPGDGLSDMTTIIEHFETAFDWEEAETTGRIVPCGKGVDEAFDEADSIVQTVTEKLSDYLSKQRKKFGNSSEINYVKVGNEAYQMEVPEELHAKVPASYEVRSSRKGYQRYWTPEIKDLLQDLAAGEQQRELALQGILKGLVKRFCGHYQKWLSLIKSVAELDVLISLAEASEYASPSCTPTFISAGTNSDVSSMAPTIFAKGLRHPTLKLNGSGTVVPNDIELGSRNPFFMLLTGPNMGGKSTLIRQVCLAVVLAQVGADVPAEHFTLSPVDKVFVRMGARDHIMAGQSTFLVEMSETASMLRGATSNSLVALDELGRGTSTADGQAIAHAVMERLVNEVGCRGMFSTHYHRLSTQYPATDAKVGLYHMSCNVGTEAGGLEEVTFLYKLAPGPCPKSYGVNVARLAGIPEAVLGRASVRSAELESSWAEKDKSRPEVSDDIQTKELNTQELPKEVVVLIRKLLDEVGKGEGGTELLSTHEAVNLLLKLNTPEIM